MTIDPGRLLMRRALRLGIAIGVLGGLGLHGMAGAQRSDVQAASEIADPTLKAARMHFRLGVDLYREGNYAGALIEFRTAYETRPNYKLLYNLAQCCIELHQYGAAADYLRRYLEDSEGALPSEQRDEANQTLGWLEMRVVRVEVIASQPDAEIYVDDTWIGNGPTAQAIQLDVGWHKFAAKKVGLPPVEAVIDITAGRQQPILLEFPARPIPKQSHARRAPPQAEPERAGWMSNPLFISTAAATALLATGAVTLSVLSLTAANDYAAARDHWVAPDAVEQLRSRAQTRALAADILWCATLASAALATVVLLDSHDESAPEHPAPSASLVVAPLRLTFRGAF
jgi:tetratricopeptide (TPR) repeat protein